MSGRLAIRRLAGGHWALLAVCALFLIAAAFVYDDYDPWIDTGPQRAIGNAPIEYLAGAGEGAPDDLPDHDRAYGAIIETPLILAERFLDLLAGEGTRISGAFLSPPVIAELVLASEGDADIWIGRHFLSHLFFLAGGVCCYLLVLRLFGSKALAIAAMLLFLLHPRIFAHSFFNSKDVPFLAAFMISLYLIHRAFRRDTLGAFLLCGVGVGLLVNLRIMGIILFAAVLALRALDLVFARGVGERKRALLTGGAFALAAVLVYYASLPWLWTDPVGRFAELLRITASHPNPGENLFQGELLDSRDGPPWDYIPVWIGITSPPVVLALALVGVLALAWRGLRRPRDIVRNGPLRFGFLSLVLAAGTVVAIVVLQNNIYNDWRQLFFLWAPLLLLGMFGLHWLVSLPRGTGRRYRTAGAYTLAGVGVIVASISIIRIHPYDDHYFTFLTDRTSPEGLAVYAMYGYQHTGDLLRSIPASEMPDAMDLDPVFRTGERRVYMIRGQQACFAARSVGFTAVQIYASTLACVADPELYVRNIRDKALLNEPLARSAFNVHHDGRDLFYIRERCAVDDVTDGFVLHVFPVDSDDLPSSRSREQTGFEDLGYVLSYSAVRLDEICVAIVRIPDYPISRIRTGQNGDSPWEATLWLDGERPSDYAAARRDALAREPLARSAFDVYLTGRALTYVRDGCSDEDAAPRFFLHIDPVDASDLPEYRRAQGSDNLDFSFTGSGARPDGNCVAVVPLPDYPIVSGRTGQYDETGQLWSVALPLATGEASRVAAQGERVASSIYDVYWDGSLLAYVRDGCTTADADPIIFLHVYPERTDDLPDDRRPHGFENHDFRLADRGALLDGRCIALAVLPNYPIASIRTGQYDETGQLWEVEFALPAAE